MAAGVVHVPWYATGFRGDALEEALAEIASISLRYGASNYHVYRYREDRYRFLQASAFEDKMGWDRYWHGDEFIEFRVRYSSAYQVPVLYGWVDLVSHGEVTAPPETTGETLAGGRAQGDTVM
jgi:hypothetical protein